MPCAYLEYTDATRSIIQRLVFVTYHPEAFLRERGHKLSDAKRNIAFRERLIDFATVLLYGETRFQTFFSTGNWFYQMSTGIIIPLTAFLRFTEENDTLSKYFKRPNLNSASMDQLLSTVEALKPKKKMIQNVRTINNVKPSKAVEFWARAEVVAEYGEYRTTYALMAARFVAATQASRAKTKKREAEEPPEVQEERRKRVNKQVADRKKKYAAAKVEKNQTQLAW